MASNVQVNAGMANNKEDENKCLDNFEGGRNITDETKGHVDEVGTCFEGEEEGSEVEANSNVSEDLDETKSSESFEVLVKSKLPSKGLRKLLPNNKI